MGFIGFLQLMLIGLKFTGFITASWFIVLLPFILCATIWVVAIFLAVLGVACSSKHITISNKWKR